MKDVREEIIILDSSDPRAGAPCAVCSKPVAAKEEAVFCPRCKSAHHLACWVERGGCGRHGCRQVARRDLLPAKHEEPIRPSKLPRWAVWSVVAAIVLVAGWLGWSARTASLTRASTMTVMVPSLDDEVLWFKLVDDYNRNPPTEKRVELLYTPYGPTGMGYDQKLVVLIAARDGPEVVVLEPDRFTNYVEQQALVPVDDIVYALLEEGIPLDPDRLQEASRDGVYYGLPHPTREAFLVSPVVTRHTGEGPRLLYEIARRLYAATAEN